MIKFITRYIVKKGVEEVEIFTIDQMIKGIDKVIYKIDPNYVKKTKRDKIKELIKQKRATK